jgi:hypothetical protein
MPQTQGVPNRTHHFPTLPPAPPLPLFLGTVRSTPSDPGQDLRSLSLTPSMAERLLPGEHAFLVTPGTLMSYCLVSKGLILVPLAELLL